MSASKLSSYPFTNSELQSFAASLDTTQQDLEQIRQALTKRASEIVDTKFLVATKRFRSFLTSLKETNKRLHRFLSYELGLEKARKVPSAGSDTTDSGMASQEKEPMVEQGEATEMEQTVKPLSMGAKTALDSVWNGIQAEWAAKGIWWPIGSIWFAYANTLHFAETRQELHNYDETKEYQAVMTSIQKEWDDMGNEIAAWHNTALSAANSAKS